jgi:hypothetical protein
VLGAVDKLLLLRLLHSLLHKPQLLADKSVIQHVSIAKKCVRTPRVRVLKHKRHAALQLNSAGRMLRSVRGAILANLQRNGCGTFIRQCKCQCRYCLDGRQRRRQGIRTVGL